MILSTYTKWKFIVRALLSLSESEPPEIKYLRLEHKKTRLNAKSLPMTSKPTKSQSPLWGPFRRRKSEEIK